MTDTLSRVLVVEDDIEIRRFVCLSLEHEGFEVHEADGVQRGLIEAGTRRPDIVVLDLGVAELLARVRAHLRRSGNSAQGSSLVVEFGDVKIDLARRTVERAGEPVHVTPIEYRLLTHLTAHPHCVLTHQQLLKAVWGPSHDEDTHYLRVYMGQLRKKFEQDPAQPRYLVTETAIGYRFVP